MTSAEAQAFNLGEKDPGRLAGKLDNAFIAFAVVAIVPAISVVYHDLTTGFGPVFSPINVLLDSLAGFFAAAGFAGAYRFRGFAPDSACVGPEGLQLLRRSRVLHTLRWNDPGFSMLLLDLSADARANSLPRVALWSYKIRANGSFWPMTPEFMTAVLQIAKEQGLSVSQTDSRRFHFPDGTVYRLSTARA